MYIQIIKTDDFEWDHALEGFHAQYFMVVWIVLCFKVVELKTVNLTYEILYYTCYNLVIPDSQSNRVVRTPNERLHSSRRTAWLITIEEHYATPIPIPIISPTLNQFLPEYVSGLR
jgi:hypothetical protein